MKLSYSLFIPLLTLFSTGPVSAVTTVYVEGTVIEPAACTIPGASVIYVDLGQKILSSNIDGTNYLTDFSIPLSCTGSSSGVDMQLSGDPTTYDTKFMKTNKTDLGVRFLRNSALQPINSWFAVEFNQSVQMQVAPVKRPGSVIPGGSFNAIATVSLRLP